MINRLVVLLFFVFGTLHANAINEIEEQSISSDFLGHIKLLNELSDRRRSNLIHENPQTIFDGVQVSYVNTHSGNLTFKVKDLVLRSRLSLQAARIYDSRSSIDRGFGPGWKLGIQETLVQNHNEFTLLHADASVTRLTRNDDTLVPLLPTPEIASLEFESKDTIGWSRGGLRKTFSKTLPGTYQLRAIEDGFGNKISLNYSGDLIVSLEDSDGFEIEVIRDNLGRIIGLRDNTNRKVTYDYDESGFLSKVTDVGGNVRHYSYENGMLVSINSSASVDLKVSYDKAGKVASVDRGDRATSFRYKNRRTQVWRGEEVTPNVLTTNRLGVTIKSKNAAGEVSKVGFDSSNRVKRLVLQDQEKVQFRYSPNGKIKAVKDADGKLKIAYRFREDGGHTVVETLNNDEFVRTYEYDQLGMLSSIIENDQEVSQFGWNETGDLSMLRQEGKEYELDYTSSGALEALRTSLSELRFEHDETNRPLSSSFLNLDNQTSFTTSYDYDNLGIKRSAAAEGTSVEYLFNENGIMYSATTTNLTETKQQTIESFPDGRTSRIQYGDEAFVDVEYDESGRVKAIDKNGTTATYGYDEVGRLTSVVDGPDSFEYSYEDGERDILGQFDDTTYRTVVPSNSLTSLRKRKFLPLVAAPMQNVYFDESAMSFHKIEHWNYETTEGLLNLRELQQTMLLNYTQYAAKGFNRLSNRYFQPLEFASLNCCIPCNAFPHLCGTCQSNPFYKGNYIEFPDYVEDDINCYCYVQSCSDILNPTLHFAGSVSVSGTAANPIIARLNQLFNHVGIFATINAASATGTRKVGDCCPNPALPQLPIQGRQELTAAAAISYQIRNQFIGRNFTKMIHIPGVGTISAGVRVGGTVNKTGSLGGTMGFRSSQCSSSQNCGFGNFNVGFTPDVELGVTVMACQELFNSQGACLTFLEFLGGVAFSTTGTAGYNLNSCNTGLAGQLVLGRVVASVSVKVGGITVGAFQDTIVEGATF